MNAPGQWCMEESQNHRQYPSDVPDPNSETNKTAIKYWVKFADFYQWPHIQHYSSVEDLIKHMETTNLKKVSDNMKKYNEQFKEELSEKWAKILKNVAKYSLNQPH